VKGGGVVTYRQGATRGQDGGEELGHGGEDRRGEELGHRGEELEHGHGAAWTKLSEQWRGGQGLRLGVSGWGGRLSGRGHSAVRTAPLWRGAWQCRPCQRSVAQHMAPGGRCRLTGGPASASGPLRSGTHAIAIFLIQKTSKINFLHKKNRYKVREDLRKFLKVGNEIRNTFHT
jgi:hypothetical protein